MYTNAAGVLSAGKFGVIPPLGQIEFEIAVNQKHPYVSLAVMGVNTNDMFVGFSGVRLIEEKNGLLTKTELAETRLFSPGYDAGTEENDENCANIPGPACGGNGAPGGGEGVVYIHPGIVGGAGLTPAPYDWRNPMLCMEVSFTK